MSESAAGALTIRAETSADFDAIRRVNRLAFGGDLEVRLVDALRDGGWLRLSLVAERDSEIVGHILFSELPIETPQGTLPALSLAPVAVLPEHQKQGIGSELIRQGLVNSRLAGYRIVIVVGHPEYYPRFGFSAELARPLESPYAGEACMALELEPGVLNGVTGRVTYPPPFAS